MGRFKDSYLSIGYFYSGFGRFLNLSSVLQSGNKVSYPGSYLHLKYFILSHSTLLSWFW